MLLTALINITLRADCDSGTRPPGGAAGISVRGRPRGRVGFLVASPRGPARRRVAPHCDRLEVARAAGADGERDRGGFVADLPVVQTPLGRTEDHPCPRRPVTAGDSLPTVNSGAIATRHPRSDR